MAQLTVSGLEEIAGGFNRLANLPDSVIETMIDAEADIVIEAQKRRLDELNLVKTGQLRNSIKKDEKLYGKGFSKYKEVYPMGTRDDGVRNAEVGFILEYGAPHKHLDAKNWMESANDESAEAATEAAADVYEEYLSKF